jgi:hypothetical protein
MYSMIQSTDSAHAASPERPRRRGGGVGGSSPAGTHVPFSTWYLSPPGFMYALVQPSLGQRYARSRGPSIARLAGRRRARGAGEGERSATGDTQRGDAVGGGDADAVGVVGMSESEADENEDESGDGAAVGGDAAGSSKSVRRNALTSTSSSHAAGGGGGRTIPRARGSGCAASKCARSACSDGSAHPQHAKLEHCTQRQRSARGTGGGAHEGLLERVRVGGGGRGRVGRAARARQTRALYARACGGRTCQCTRRATRATRPRGRRAARRRQAWWLWAQRRRGARARTVDNPAHAGQWCGAVLLRARTSADQAVTECGRSARPRPDPAIHSITCRAARDHLGKERAELYIQLRELAGSDEVDEEEGAGAGDVEGEPPFRSRVHRPQPRASIARRIKPHSPSLWHPSPRALAPQHFWRQGRRARRRQKRRLRRQKIRLSRRGFEPLPPYGDEKPRLR